MTRIGAWKPPISNALLVFIRALRLFRGIIAFLDGGSKDAVARNLARGTNSTPMLLGCVIGSQNHCRPRLPARMDWSIRLQLAAKLHPEKRQPSLRHGTDSGSRSKTMFAYLHLLLTGPLVIAFSGATAPPDAQDAAFPTAAEIRHAWTHRSKTMGPYAFRAELTEQAAVKGRPLSSDPFESRRKVREVNLVTVQKTIGMRKDGVKLRTAVVGKSVDSDNGNVSEQQHHSSFDGRQYKTLGKRADMPLWLGALLLSKLTSTRFPVLRVRV